MYKTHYFVKLNKIINIPIEFFKTCYGVSEEVADDLKNEILVRNQD